MSSQTLETLSQRVIELISTHNNIPKEDISLDVDPVLRSAVEQLPVGNWL